jgi:hypothetical protein
VDLAVIAKLAVENKAPIVHIPRGRKTIGITAFIQYHDMDDRSFTFPRLNNYAVVVTNPDYNQVSDLLGQGF